MTTPLTGVVDGYTELASSLLDQWSDHMSTVAEHLEDPEYDADRAAADLAECVTLATETGFLLANEVLEALAVLGARRGLGPITSDPFHAPPGSAVALGAPLDDGFGHYLSASVVPDQLGPGQTAFTLHANVTGYPSATYWGTVIATPPGAASSHIPVWMVVG